MKHIFVTLALAFAAVILPPVTTTAQTLSGIINSYTSISGYNTDCGCITVASAKEFRSGDRVLLYQAQGALVLRSQDDLFGVVSNAAQSGVFEFATIASINENRITLFTQLVNQFDFTSGTVQLVKVVTGSNINLGNVEAKQFDGASGGIIVVEASGSVSINGTINARAKGFRGGITAVGSYVCGQRAYSFPSGSPHGGMKGESVARYDATAINGRGAWANGGGGGNNHNAGGGGGGNAFTGGFGGYAWGNCPMKNDEQARGIGGFGLNYNANSPRMYFGGGGGAGHRNDTYNTSGGNGGGIVIIIAENINVNGGSILANGGDAARVELDGAGGGGAGGSVLLYASNIANALTVDVRGGNGGDARHIHGPGGGGSAGVVLVKQDQLPTGLTVLQQGGRSGMNYELGGNAASYVQTPYGATNGESGAVISSVRVAMANGASVNPLIVTTQAPTTVCNNQTLSIRAIVPTNSDVTYSWSGKGVRDTNASEITVRPTSTTTYTVRVQDARGCTAIDSVTVVVNAPMSVTTNGNKVICSGNNAQLEAYTSGGNGSYTYSWSPALGLNNATSIAPIASPTQTTTYTLRVRDEFGCEAIDSVTVTVSSKVQPILSGDTTVCPNTQHIYSITNASTAKMVWAVSGASSMELRAQGKEAAITWGAAGVGRISISGDANSGDCIAVSTTSITISSMPSVTIDGAAERTICKGTTTTLVAQGIYEALQWSNGATTSSITVGSGDYRATVRNAAGCQLTSSTVVVNEESVPELSIQQRGGAPCSSDAVVLDAGEWAAYVWSTGATTRTITVSENATVSIKVRNTNGCELTSAPFSVILGKQMSPSLSGAQTVCLNTSHVYRAVGSISTSRFTWSVRGASDVRMMGARNDSALVTWDNNYSNSTITVIETSSNCSGQSMLTVIKELSQITMPTLPNVSIKNGESTTLDAGEGYTSYVWSTGATTRTITVTKAGTYSVIVTSASGCTAQSNLATVTMLRSRPVVDASNTSICEGSEAILVAQGVEVGGRIQWSNGATTEQVIVSKAGTYSFSITTATGDVLVSDTVSVSVWANPVPTITTNGNTLQSTPAVAYQWLYRGVEIHGATSRTYEAQKSGAYAVRTVTDNGCMNISAERMLTLVSFPVVRVSVANVNAKVGSKAIVVVRAQSTINTLESDVRYQAVLSVQASQLAPVGATPIGEVRNGRRFIAIEGTSGFNGVLTALEFTALLDGEQQSEIRIESITFQSEVTTEIENGIVTVEAECASRGKQAVEMGFALHLKQNYPNPFVNSTTIEFSLTEANATTLAVYTMTGSLVATILDAEMQRGNHSVVFDGSNLPNGSYMLVLQTPVKRASLTMTVQR